MSGAARAIGKLIHFLEERFPAEKLNVHSLVAKKEVPIHRMSWAYYLGGLVLLRNGEAVGDISVRGRIADTTIDTYGYTAGVADQWEVIAVDGSGNRAVSPAVSLTATTGVDHAPIPNIRVGSRRVAAGDNVLRLLPPLVVSEEDLSEGVERLDRACRRLEAA